MSPDQVLDEFRGAGALREGRFVLSPGLHSPMVPQKALVSMHPDPSGKPGSRRLSA